MKYGITTSRPSTLMESFFGDEFMNTFTYGTDLDIYKEGNNYFVDLEIPGFNKEDIEISYKGDILSIKAEHKHEEESEEKDYFYRSRSYQNVHRQIRFSDVDENKIEAKYQNGVLKLVLPAKTESDLVNKIEIQ